MNRKMSILIAVAIALAATGCSSSRTAVTVQEGTQITKGRELTDLQRALEAGAVTQKEYETVRRAIMRRDN